MSALSIRGPQKYLSNNLTDDQHFVYTFRFSNAQEGRTDMKCDKVMGHNIVKQFEKCI